MIDLSNKAAKRFRINWKDLKERSGDFWKVEAVMIGRVPMLYIVHEYTLFTMVRRKSEFRDPLIIADEIIQSCPWYRSPATPSLGRNGNRRLTGSITEMKRMTVGLYSPEQINAMEMSINQSLFSYLSTNRNGYSTPFEAVESYVKERTPWL
ncbi:hypothetical protein [Desulfosarcina sp.]|uniref:hypothetical protein n=1 Tax=Desulfosarcina sp. TaxID=2027861 RepID=UPI0029B6A4A7|nr:hypothetical protein [Desulfosarcina sp.]MDX2454836.1 hypothetical protein [Desulfosarcina sp.]MDX2492442.1 hypothetical protein [Desulfosarcina sp.]